MSRCERFGTRPQTAPVRDVSARGKQTGRLDAFAAAVDVPPLPSEAMIVHIGGRLNQLAANDGAVGNRDAHIIATDSPATWARQSWQAVRPFRSLLTSTSRWATTGREAARELIRTTYGANFARLVEVLVAW